MPSTLTAATKLHTVPQILDKINSLGSPDINPSCLNNGEGSSFLSIPTKRNFHPKNQQQNHGNGGGASSVFKGIASSLSPIPFSSSSSSSNNSNGGSSGAGSDKPVFVDFKSALIPLIKQACYTQTSSSSYATTSASAINSSNHLVSNCYGDSIQIPAQLMPTDQQWCNLNQLRVHAGAPERNERGIEKLMNYYAQLCWLEEKFAFDTDEFTWFEAFQPKKRVDTSCIQFEKASVIWNIGALYSQLGCLQSLWTPEGLKTAAQYFQRAAGAFFHVRDTLVPRIMVKIDASSDLSETTLSAIGEFMLAQAIECFYLKAEFDNTSSPVTSQIAAQTADYYDIAYKASKSNNSFGKYRFPKFWITHMHVKHLLYLANAHLHSPNFSTPDSVVGERLARVKLAQDYAEKALEKAMSVDGMVSAELRVLANSFLDRIRNSLDQVDKANFNDYHQSQWKPSGLKPLRRPPHTLVSATNVVEGNGCGSITDLVMTGIIVDIFDGVIGMMCLGTGNTSPLRKYSVPIVANVRKMSHQHQQLSNAGGAEDYTSPSQGQPHRNSLQSLQHAMNSNSYQLPQIRRFTDGDLLESARSIAPYVTEKVKKLVWDVKSSHDMLMKEFYKVADPISGFLDNEGLAYAQEICQKLSDEINSDENVLKRGEEMLSLYHRCEKTNISRTTKQMQDTILALEKEISLKLNQINNNLFNSEKIRSKLGRRESEISEILKLRPVITQALSVWNGKSSAAGGKSSSTESLVKSFAISRQDIANLIKEMNEEGYLELFQHENGSTVDVHWSESKIRTVVPCLQDEWKSKYQEMEKRLWSLWKSLVASLGEIYDYPDKASPVEILSVLVDLAKQQQSSYADLLNGLEAEKEKFDSFCKQWLRDTQGQNSSIIESLKSFALDGESSVKYQNQSDHILMGVEKVQSRLKELTFHFNQMINHSASVSIEKPSFHSLAKMMLAYQESAQQSGKLISVFMEQLEKWNTWNISIQDAIESLEDSLRWIETTFSAVHFDPQSRRESFASTYAKSEEQTHHTPTTIPSDTLSKPQKKSNDLQALMNRQERLQHQQIETSWNIADKTIDEANKNFVAPFRQAFDLESADLRKRLAMRKLSLTASAIDKVSRSINASREMVRAPEDQVHLMKQKDELSQRLRMLNQQQREFIKLHNEQMSIMQSMGALKLQQKQQTGLSTVATTTAIPQSRRPSMGFRKQSIIDSAREKLKSIIGVGGKKNDETIVINSPVKSPAAEIDEFDNNSSLRRSSVASAYSSGTAPASAADPGMRRPSAETFGKRPPPFAPSAPEYHNNETSIARRKSSIQRRPVNRSSLGHDEHKQSTGSRKSSTNYSANYYKDEYGFEVQKPQYSLSRQPKQQIHFPFSLSDSHEDFQEQPQQQQQQNHAVKSIPRKTSRDLKFQETVEVLAKTQENRLSDHLPPLKPSEYYKLAPSKAKTTPKNAITAISNQNHKKQSHFIDHPSHLRPDSAFMDYDDTASNAGALKSRMDAVTKYFAWNRDSFIQRPMDFISAEARRGSLGGDPYIP